MNALTTSVIPPSVGARGAMHFRPASIAFIFFLSALGGITPLSIDTGLPALSAVGTSLHVPPSSAGLTLSFFLGGFAFGPVFLGPLSDRFGRRPVLLAGMSVFALAGIGCALASSLSVLLFWRLLAGIGAGAGSTLSLAIVRDLFDGAEARVRLSYVGTVATVAPMIAPTLGALILYYAGWRNIYGFLAFAGLLLLAAVFLGFKESHAAVDSSAIQPRRLIANYVRIFRHPVVLGYMLIGALSFGCMFSYITSSPLVMIGVLGVSPAFYGFTFAATALGIMGGAFVNGRLSARGVRGKTLLKVGLTASALSAVALVLVSHSPFVSLSSLLPLLVLNTFCGGLIGPNVAQGALHPMPEIAGATSAVLGSMRMLFGATAGILVSWLFDGHSAHAMTEMMGLFSITSLLVYHALVRPIEPRSF
jgi:DHA1 family bicyclomycin/chloramphenicol resistance-like MFS transporter